MEIDVLLQNVVIAAFACVGLIEVVKNFLKTEKKWIFSLIMIPLSVACYFACVCLPGWVIGGVLTVGVTQLCYQTIVQTFQAVVKMVGNKAATSSAVENNDNKEEDKDE